MCCFAAYINSRIDDMVLWTETQENKTIPPGAAAPGQLTSRSRERPAALGPRRCESAHRSTQSLNNKRSSWQEKQELL